MIDHSITGKCISVARLNCTHEMPRFKALLLAITGDPSDIGKGYRWNDHIEHIIRETWMKSEHIVRILLAKSLVDLYKTSTVSDALDNTVRAETAIACSAIIEVLYNE